VAIQDTVKTKTDSIQNEKLLTESFPAAKQTEQEKKQD
jgi:hypothetical protein